jgi:HSP20 family protein
MGLPVRRGGADHARSDRLEPLSLLGRSLSRSLGLPDVAAPLGQGFVPLADVEESADAYLVEVELPGIRREDVSVEVAGRRLAVSGERKERERVGILRKRTRSVGRFHYQVTLPGAVEEAGVEASMDAGVLTVRVTKAERERPRRIQIT